MRYFNMKALSSFLILVIFISICRIFDKIICGKSFEVI